MSTSHTYVLSDRASASSPVGAVLDGPIFGEKVGKFIQSKPWVHDWLHVGVAAE